MASISVEIFDAQKIQRLITTIDNVSAEDSVLSLKKRIAERKDYLPVERQSLRLDAKGKSLKDEERVGDLNLPSKGGQLFVKDLGPQVGYKTVFLVEYAGPFFIYPLFFLRPSFIYGSGVSTAPMSPVVILALICWCTHFAKRLLETQFVHRFSKGTMPQFNLFKNCSYYWGFAAFVGYFVNHPLYTPPYFGATQIYSALVCFVISELGNLSIHVLLRNLRPAGSKERKIPMPNSNPLTKLFNFVSCPNYTYEVIAWLSFSVMTQTLPGLIFTFVGFVQMAIWAKGKHRSYLKDFRNYPRNRKAIVPFLL